MRKLSRKFGARRSLVKNLASSLILYEKITTTEAKGKEVIPFVEHCVTISQSKDLTSYRRLREILTLPAAKKLHEHLNERFIHPTGTIRLLRLGQRVGDAAQMVRLELIVKEPITATNEKKEKSSKKEVAKGTKISKSVKTNAK